MIKVENVTKRFTVGADQSKTAFDWVKEAVMGKKTSEITVLDDVSFRCPPGSVTGIIGRNGSGKSTLLRIIADILPPETGTVETKGKLVPVLDLGLGFHPELTGLENCYLYGSLLGFSRTEMRQRLPEIFSTAGVSSFKHTKLKYYSTGMKARLGFSVMINVKPDVMVLDEIFTVGDKDFKPFCERKLREFKDAGKTILLASHSEKLLTSFCDRLLCLEEGKIVRQGKPDQVLAYYNKHV